MGRSESGASCFYRRPPRRQPAMEAMKEKAKKAIEDQMGDNAPPYLKPFFACCGGEVCHREVQGYVRVRFVFPLCSKVCPSREGCKAQIANLPGMLNRAVDGSFKEMCCDC